jgi:2-C-methyl-D-erythritol 4-phosphate cytidylyltransferase/2-C-methyl-D-erythritol 2,4-cyclodiphosphate synthase
MRVAAIIVAGGRGQRLGARLPKQLIELGGRSILQRSVEAFLEHPRVDRVVVVLPLDLVGAPPEYLVGTSKPMRIVSGGPRRQDSVANGVAALDGTDDIVLIHDAARPFVDAEIIDRTIDAADRTGAAIAAMPARDTVKLASEDGCVARTIPREQVFLAQTPQAFRRDVLERAIDLGRGEREATDEAALVERAGLPVRLVEGGARNMKITTPDDLAFARGLLMSDAGTTLSPIRIGIGYDLHTLVEGRRLVLGGIEIPFERGLAGHSDADVLCHAITDAVLGAAAAGDIGRHFPDTDERWRSVSSIELLREAARLVRDGGFGIVNVDAIVVAERPKLAPHVGAIVARVAETLGIAVSEVSVKGKTSERIGEIGRGEAMAAHAVALLVKQ